MELLIHTWKKWVEKHQIKTNKNKDLWIELDEEIQKHNIK